MKALYFKPYEAVETVDVDDFDEILGGPVDTFWPFENSDICLVALADREDLAPNRTFDEFGTIRGPFLVVGYHDDFDDLTDEEVAKVESDAEFAEEEYETDDYDPFEEDAQEEEDYCGVRIVDEDEFYEEISGGWLSDS